MRTPAKLVTIITEALLEERIVDLIRRAGATGYSLGQVRGEGSRGVRASSWEGQNVRVEVVASTDVADRIIDELASAYFPSYAVIAWLSDIEVVRGEKYGI